MSVACRFAWQLRAYYTWLRRFGQVAKHCEVERQLNTCHIMCLRCAQPTQTHTHTHTGHTHKRPTWRILPQGPQESAGSVRERCQRTPAHADFPPWCWERLIQALAAHLGQASIKNEIKLEQNEVQDKATDKEIKLEQNNVQDKATDIGGARGEAHGPDAEDVP